MPIVIRDADPKRDRKVMMDCLLRNRARYEDNDNFQTRFDWAYSRNPHGEGRAWLALDDSNDRVVGFTSAFPRRVFVNGEMMIGWNCADFSIDQDYRTLGVAMKLRRAAKECVDKGEFQFLFAHPNDRMRVVHEKVGHLPIGKMERYAALLRFDNKLHDQIGNKLAANALALLANPVLHFTTPGRSRAAQCSFSLVAEKRFGDEYERVFEAAKARHQVIVARDAEYLTWRFLENPLYRTRSLRMHCGNELKGYVLFYETKGTAHVADLLVAGNNEDMRALMSGLIYHLRKAGLGTISLRLHNDNPVLAQALQLGFKHRADATSTVIAYAKPSSSFAPTILDGKHWFMTVGDRDI